MDLSIHFLASFEHSSSSRAYPESWFTRLFEILLGNQHYVGFLYPIHLSVTLVD